MLQKITGFLLVFALVTNWQISYTFSAENLSHEEVEKVIEEVANSKNIPSVILKAIAWKESKYRQFNRKGDPFISNGNVGIMQVNQVHKGLDQERLKNDIKYNIEAGADILLGKWYSAGKIYPKIGDMNPNILENWYFSLWGYNGWVDRNNPNVGGEKAYQEQIFNLIRTKYKQPITSLAREVLPKTGLPSGDMNFKTPEPRHEVKKSIVVSRSGGRRAVFQDIVDHPKRDYIEVLYKEKIISGSGDNRFYPDRSVSREEMITMIGNALKIEGQKEAIAVKDWEDVSPWAVEKVVAFYRKGWIKDQEQHLKPKEFVTREEALTVLHRVVSVKNDGQLYLSYIDKNEISAWAQEGIKHFAKEGILTPDPDGKIRPKDLVTRGELSEWLAKVIKNR